MQKENRFGLLGLVVVFVALVAAPAQAGETSRLDGIDLQSPTRNAEIRGTFASFEGRRIDLSKNWGEATACLVWRQGGVVECFRNDEALDARATQLEPRRQAAAATAVTAAYSYSCSSALRLYQDNWYGGRRLTFWDRGYWQNLGDYGFEDQTSSYIVGGCYTWLAEHADGGGWWYGGPTYPYAGEPVMSWDWQDRISSIYIG